MDGLGGMDAVPIQELVGRLAGEWRNARPHTSGRDVGQPKFVGLGDEVVQYAFRVEPGDRNSWKSAKLAHDASEASVKAFRQYFPRKRGSRADMVERAGSPASARRWVRATRGIVSRPAP